MNARCCMPPESVRTGVSAFASSPTRAIASATSRWSSAPKPPDDPPRGQPSGRDDLANGRRCVSAGLRALGEIPERVPAREPVGGLAVQECRTLARSLEPEEDPHERRLAASVRAGDRDELALAEREVDSLEHALPGPIAEGDASELDR